MDSCLSIMALFIRRMTLEVVRLKDLRGEAYSATQDDMRAAGITTPYKHIFTWLVGRVNQCAAPNLRHSTQDRHEKDVRANLVQDFKGWWREEQSEDVESQVDYDRIWMALGIQATDDEVEQAAERTRDAVVERRWQGLPMPQFSAFHAPGGDLAQRDRAEFNQANEAVAEIVRDQEEIQHQYRIAFPDRVGRPRLTKAEKAVVAKQKQEAHLELLQEMRHRGWEPDDGDDKFSKEQIRDFKKVLKDEERDALRTRRPGIRRPKRGRDGDAGYPTTKRFKGSRDVYDQYPEFRASVAKWTTELVDERADDLFPGRMRESLTRDEATVLKQWSKDKSVRLFMCISSTMSSYDLSGTPIPDDINVILNLPQTVLKAYVDQWHTGDSAQDGQEHQALGNNRVGSCAAGVVVEFRAFMMRDGAMWQQGAAAMED